MKGGRCVCRHHHHHHHHRYHAALILLLLFLLPRPSELRGTEEAPPPPLPPAQQKLAWFTPIIVQPLTHEDASFSSSLASRAIELYDMFLSMGQPGLREVVCAESGGLCGRGGANYWMDLEEPHQFNDAFFRFQLSRGMRDFESLPAFQRLRAHVRATIEKMAAATGATSGSGSSSSDGAGDVDGNGGGYGADGLFCWSSVHPAGSGSHHPAHTHAGAAFSAVFFASLPAVASSSPLGTAAAAPLVFRDPRGALPPFDHSIVHRPVEGDLVVFPSWLSHEVRPATPHRTTTPSSNKRSKGSTSTTSQRVSVESGGEQRGSNARNKEGLREDLRVSISCNARGDWGQTADLSVTFDA